MLRFNRIRKKEKVVQLFLSHSYIRRALFSNIGLDWLLQLFLLEDNGEEIRSRFIAEEIDDETALLPEPPDREEALAGTRENFLQLAGQRAAWIQLLTLHKYQLMRYPSFLHYLLTTKQSGLEFNIADLYRIMLYDSFRTSETSRSVKHFVALENLTR